MIYLLIINIFDIMYRKIKINVEMFQMMAPQFEHRLFLHAKQHKIPIGKQKIARQIPRHE